ncbi:zinc protease [Breznakibacter xylanolyticus]|uniref:Zinc protease n=1 Tax=Breznakibacter xylanolyticus TaxID=990 RepID=A0A2W7NGH2_9BACT|nr:insulinase family protein [Breznakibacter xylanolyticus]PZX19511.1 zinc protease [Breznakibacter xylanolyticus]
MKKFVKLFVLLLLLSTIVTPVQAQLYQPDQPVPFDPNVVHGTLANGMRYYIRSNKKPEKRAEFYIVHNVGAILEEDNQNGLAHFTEHMAFNGTKHFPKKALLNYLETIGCKFGQNVNAFTGQDVTCYNIGSVPITRDGIIDSCLLILHDWSNYIAFEAEEIESERGVILEEWRTRGSAQARMSDKLRPIIYAGSKYGQRNVIGDTAVINHFDHQAIFDFYHQWYRTDLQAVIVVGDFDAKMMEQKIIARFSAIPAVENPAPKPVYGVPDNDQPIIAMATDPEATNTNISFYIKHPATPDSLKNQQYLRHNILTNFIGQMMNVRLSDLLKKESAPAITANVGMGGFSPTTKVLYASGTAKTNQTLPTFEMLLTECRRMQHHGFTQPELERAKANFLRSIESRFIERQNREHNSYVWDYYSHFTQNAPTCDIAYYRDFVKEVVPGISVNEINTLTASFFTEKNVIITLTAPEKEDIQVPSQNELLAMYEASKHQKVDAYEEKLLAQSLIETVPQKGTVVKDEKLKKFDVHQWTLSNGIKVMVKKTNFKEDEILMNGQSDGGMSQLEDDLWLSAVLMPTLVGEMGMGNHTTSDLRKMLAGKRVSTGIALGDDREIISGNCSPDDMELLLQQVHLRFTAPRFDREAFDAYMARLKPYLQYMALNPDAAFRDSVTALLTNRHPRIKSISTEALEAVTFERVEQIYRDRFSDPADFTFVFVGNIDMDKLKPLVETYLGSLPAGARKETYIDRGVRTPADMVRTRFDKTMQTPKTSVFAYYSGPIKYTNDDMLHISAIKNILDIRYVASIREKEGGTYGVSVSGSCEKQPEKKAEITLSFNTDSAKAERMLSLLHEEINNLMTQGPSAEDVQKTKELFLKSFTDRQIENGYWMSNILNNYLEGIDRHTGYEKGVKKMSPKTLQQFMAKTFSPNRMLEVVMMPAAQPSSTPDSETLSNK